MFHTHFRVNLHSVVYGLKELNSKGLIFKELFAQKNRRDIWSLSECNGVQAHKHLVFKQRLIYLAKLASFLNRWVL